MKTARGADATVSGASSATAITLVAALGVSTACWFVAIRRMAGMDMGAATELGSFDSFLLLWVLMMAAMMLPGSAPAVVRHVGRGGVHAASLFVGSYLAVWAGVGVAVYLAYRPHGTAGTAGIVIAAGVYELTPLKHHFRARCRADPSSGIGFGLTCMGSSGGLMLSLLALGVMSSTWMSAAAIVITGQKLLPARTAIDLPLGLSVVGLGILIAIAPTSVPGLTAGAM